MTAPGSPSLSDFAARLRKKNEENAPPPRDFNELYTVRARILGILIRDARLSKGLGEEQCAEELAIAPDVFRAWEMGEQSPALPQLEMLAFFLGVPVSHFWDTKTISAQPQSRTISQETYLELRDRVIGAQLRMARQDSRLSQEQLAQACGLPIETIDAYELAQRPIPFTHLAALAPAVKRALADFLDDASRVGDWLARQEDYQRFDDLPAELREFVLQPGNRIYLELAMRLSGLPLQDLRQVGESILNITY